MAKINKVGMTVVMALLLGLTLLTSGAFAQSTTTTGSSVNQANRVAALPANAQQETQQTLPIVYKQERTTAQPGYWCRWGACYGYRHARFYRRGGVRCYWARRGWGRYRRSVRVCRSW